MVARALRTALQPDSECERLFRLLEEMLVDFQARLAQAADPPEVQDLVVSGAVVDVVGQDAQAGLGLPRGGSDGPRCRPRSRWRPSRCGRGW